MFLCYSSYLYFLGFAKKAMYLLSTFGISVSDEMAKCDSCHIWYHHYCMDIPSEGFGDSVRSTGSVRGVCEYTHLKYVRAENAP